MKQTWNTIAILMVALIGFAAHAQTIKFPGPARVITMSHALIPVELGSAIQGVQFSNIDHVGVTTVRNGVSGVSHSDGVGGSRFTPWADFHVLYVTGTLRVFQPNYTEMGRRELATYGIECEVLACVIGQIRKHMWMQVLQQFEGRPYDFLFQTDPETTYCSEHLALTWNAICPVPLFPLQLAGTMPGWELEIDEYGTTLGMVFMSIGVMPTTPVWPPAYPSWDTGLFTEEEVELEELDGC